jgi:diguanylate cyclase (GGDEF)-like protein
MSVTMQRALSADETARLEGKVRLFRASPPMPDHPGLRDWALSVAAAAERRVTELEARIAFLEDLAVTDELTGAMNRRGFLMEFSRALDAARRGGQKGALIICDLDGFKTVNDRLGHAVGDEVLREVAALLLRGVRRMDVAARLGGDEFALLLIGADMRTAQRRLESFARGISALAPKLNGLSLPLSASFGIAEYDGSEDEETVLNRADMSMYREKRERAALAQRRAG